MAADAFHFRSRFTPVAEGLRARDDLLLACRRTAQRSSRTELLVDMAEQVLSRRTAADVWNIAEYGLDIELKTALQWQEKLDASVKRARAGDSNFILLGEWRMPQALCAALKSPSAKNIMRRPLHATDREVLAARGVLLLYEVLAGQARPDRSDRLLDAAEAIHMAFGRSRLEPAERRALWRRILDDQWPEIRMKLPKRGAIPVAVTLIVEASAGSVRPHLDGLAWNDEFGDEHQVRGHTIGTALAALRRR